MLAFYLQAIETEPDREKFTALYTRYRGLMFHVAMNLLQNEQDAEDAVHQAFLSILDHFQKISDISCPKTRAFVVIIVERKALDALRRRGRESALPLNEAIRGVEIPMPGNHGLADAMARLPARQRQLLLLRYDAGYSTQEAAELLGMTQTAAQKELWRAKQTLRDLLEEIAT